MSAPNTLALAAGGLVVVALSFGAGILGASTVTPQTGAPASDVRTVPDSAVRGRIDEIGRRLTNVEERLRVVEESANAALAKAQEVDDLRRVVQELRTGGVPVAAPPTPEAPVEIVAGDGEGQMTPERRAELEAAQRDKLRRQAEEIVARNAPGLLKQRLARIADATAQGEADRRSQVYAETKQMAVLYSLTPQEEDRLREILGDTSEESVREVAPYLNGGLDRADYTAVKDRLFSVWDARDARMSEVLDEKELEEYRETQKKWREVYGKALDDMEAARLKR